jgi:hypothetical protein
VIFQPLLITPSCVPVAPSSEIYTLRYGKTIWYEHLSIDALQAVTFQFRGCLEIK